MSAPICLFLGCWGNEPGHYMFSSTPTTFGFRREKSRYADRLIAIDGTLAPRRVLEGTRTSRKYRGIIWQGRGTTSAARDLIERDSGEMPDGQFLLHHLDTGYTAIQWWDRTQGDTRPGSNSTILLEGHHTSDEMIAALHEHWAPVAANLKKVGIVLVDVSDQIGIEGEPQKTKGG